MEDSYYFTPKLEIKPQQSDGIIKRRSNYFTPKLEIKPQLIPRRFYFVKIILHQN